MPSTKMCGVIVAPLPADPRSMEACWFPWSPPDEGLFSLDRLVPPSAPCPWLDCSMAGLIPVFSVSPGLQGLPLSKSWGCSVLGGERLLPCRFCLKMPGIAVVWPRFQISPRLRKFGGETPPLKLFPVVVLLWTPLAAGLPSSFPALPLVLYCLACFASSVSLVGGGSVVVLGVWSG